MALLHSESRELLGRRLDRPERFDEQFGHLDGRRYRRPGCAPRRWHRPRPGRTGGRHRTRRPPRTGSASLGSNGWRITGTSLPGAESSRARLSGRGRRMSGNARTGIVDQRFEYIDSGRFASTGAFANVRVASVTCTSRPHTPQSAHSRTLVAVPSSKGTSEWPCVRCSGVTPNTSHKVACRSTVVVSASHVPRRNARPRDQQRDVPQLGVHGHLRLAPHARARRDSGRGRCRE